MVDYFEAQHDGLTVPHYQSHSDEPTPAPTEVEDDGYHVDDDDRGIDGIDDIGMTGEEVEKESLVYKDSEKLFRQLITDFITNFFCYSYVSESIFHNSFVKDNKKWKRAKINHRTFILNMPRHGKRLLVSPNENGSLFKLNQLETGYLHYQKKLHRNNRAGKRGLENNVSFKSSESTDIDTDIDTCVQIIESVPWPYVSSFSSTSLEDILHPSPDYFKPHVEDLIVAPLSRNQDVAVGLANFDSVGVPNLDYRRERDRLVSFQSMPKSAKCSAIICAKAGLFYTDWKDAAACYMCDFRHWDWTPEQDPSKLHRENSPTCQVALATNTDNVPYDPNLENLNQKGREKVASVLTILLPKHTELDQQTEDAKNNLQHERQLLAKSYIEDSVCVNYRLSNAPLSRKRSTPPAAGDELDNPSPVKASTKIIYYALEHARDGTPRSVPHIVDPKATVATKSGVPDELRTERKRIDTFEQKWRNAPFNPIEYARNGFFYTGTARDIKCAFCGGILSVPSVLRRFNIAGRHKRAFPTCPLVLKLEVGNIPWKEPMTEKAPQMNTETADPRYSDLTGIEQTIITIKFPEYANYEVRTMSYSNWPSTCRQDQKTLVECGFFSLGDGDAVRCFHCGGGLKNWEPIDDPWREHARWFPRCGYLQKMKGLEFVKKVREDHDVSSWIPSVDSASNDAGASGGTLSVDQSVGPQPRKRKLNLEPKPAPVVPPTTPRFPNGLEQPGVTSTGVQHRFQPREIRARMDTLGVRGLMDMGFSPVIIRFVIVNQLRDTGKDFTSMHELVEAVLDLECIVEEYGEAYLEDILKSKYDLDPLPSVLKESYYAIIDEDFASRRRIPARPPAAVRTAVASSSTSNTNNGSPVHTATVTATGDTGGERREAQTNRLEAAVTRVGNQGQGRAVGGAGSGSADTDSANQPRSRGRSSRKKRSSDKSATNDGASVSSEDPASVLAEENQRLREQNTCKICMDNTINVVFIPCGHLTACADCARTMNECPICRKSIKRKVKTYLP